MSYPQFLLSFFQLFFEQFYEVKAVTITKHLGAVANGGYLYPLNKGQKITALPFEPPLKALKMIYLKNYHNAKDTWFTLR